MLRFAWGKYINNITNRQRYVFSSILQIDRTEVAMPLAYPYGPVEERLLWQPKPNIK